MPFDSVAEEIKMKVLTLSAALLGSQSLAMSVSDRVLELKLEALCRATTADDKAMGLALAQSFEACMRGSLHA